MCSWLVRGGINHDGAIKEGFMEEVAFELSPEGVGGFRRQTVLQAEHSRCTSRGLCDAS